jgi:hypothetical protein
MSDQSKDARPLRLLVDGDLRGVWISVGIPKSRELTTADLPALLGTLTPEEQDDLSVRVLEEHGSWGTRRPSEIVERVRSEVVHQKSRGDIAENALADLAVRITDRPRTSSVEDNLASIEEHLHERWASYLEAQMRLDRARDNAAAVADWDDDEGNDFINGRREQARETLAVLNAPIAPSPAREARGLWLTQEERRRLLGLVEHGVSFERFVSSILLRARHEDEGGNK